MKKYSIDSDVWVYKAIFDYSPQGIIILDKKGKILSANKTFYDLSGYDESDVLKKNLFKTSLLSKESKKTALKKLVGRIAGKKIEPYELPLIAKSGEIKVGLITANLITSENARSVYDLVMMTDITDKKNIERQLLEEKTKALGAQELFSKVTSELNQSLHMEDSCQDVLKMLGEYTQVSRVYIFEDSDDGQTTSNTYEWCNTGVRSQIKNLQGILYKDIPSWKALLKKEKMILSNDISSLPKDLVDVLAPQNIKSILVLPIEVEGKQVGFIGFDQVQSNEPWPESDIHLLRTISNNIASVYSRQKTTEQLHAKVEELEQMNKVMIDREMKMVELKEEIKQMKK